MNSRVLGRNWILPVITIAGMVVLSACGSGGRDGPGNQPPPSGDTVTVSGRISFDRPPFNSGANGGLNIANPVELPARHVVVEAIDDASDAILASTATDTSGNYTLSVPANRNLFIRAKAQMLKADAAPTWNFRVLNNTNSDALYALDGSTFNSGTAASTRNLRATTGWGGTTYTGTRAAAPFAILDSVFQAKELVLGADPNTSFPELSLFWSINNRAATPICPDGGDIGTSLYQGAGEQQDECGQGLPSGIYILGDFGSGGGDTDEFDQHVIAHEFGHYYEDQFARSDSIGGEHGPTHLLDLRVAFGEGWGNAYSGMSLGDPVYRDSQMGVTSGFSMDLESDSTTTEGWFSESSAGEIIWDVFDTGTEPGDTIALGFGPIHSVMSGPQVETEALTSIYTFSDALREQNPASAAGINALLSNEDIFGNGEFAEGESNDGGDASVLEIYPEIAMNTPVSVCTRATAGSSDNNKLGNRKFFRFVNDASRSVTMQATGAASNAGTVAATDPDIFVFRRGAIVAAGITDAVASETLPQITLDAGTHIIEVYDFDLENNPSTTRCMTFSIAG